MAGREAHTPHIPQLKRSSLPLPREGTLLPGDPRRGIGWGLRFKGSTNAQINAGKEEDAIRADRDRTLPALVDSLTYTQYASESYSGRTIEPASLPNVPGLPRYGFTITGNDYNYNGTAFSVDVVLAFPDPSNPNLPDREFHYNGKRWESDPKGVEQPGTRAPLPSQEAEALAKWTLGLYQQDQAEKAATARRAELALIERARVEAARIVETKLTAERAAKDIAERAATEQSLRDTVSFVDNGRRGYRYTATTPNGTTLEVTYANPRIGKPTVSARHTAPEPRSKPTPFSADEAGQLLEQLRGYHQEKLRTQRAEPSEPQTDK